MRVSIIIRVYNVQDTIRKAVDSALKQDFPKRDFEVIVVNDGSTDNSLKILKSYQKRIKLINQKNQGQVPAANRGLKAACGKHVIMLDADDYFSKSILKEMAAVLDRNPEINFVYCDYYEKSFSGKTKKVSTKDNIFNTIAGGIMFRKNKLEREGFYREGIKFPEYDLLLKVQNKWKGYHIQNPLYHYNRRKESLSGKKRWVKKALAELKKLHPQKVKQIEKIRDHRQD